MGSRKSYEQSCQKLIDIGLIEDVPPLLDRMPRYDDDQLAAQFFRTEVEGEDLSSLTLPRTFFGRSEIAQTSFRNTDLRESCLCWNDFIDVDFSEADLSSCDLRASNYERVSFFGAKLDGADMRRASYIDCRFTDASLRGAILAESQKERLALSPIQVAVISWIADEGPEPGGG